MCVPSIARAIYLQCTSTICSVCRFCSVVWFVLCSRFVIVLHTHTHAPPYLWWWRLNSSILHTHASQLSRFFFQGFGFAIKSCWLKLAFTSVVFFLYLTTFTFTISGTCAHSFLVYGCVCLLWNFSRFDLWNFVLRSINSHIKYSVPLCEVYLLLFIFILAMRFHLTIFFLYKKR